MMRLQINMSHFVPYSKSKQLSKPWITKASKNSVKSFPTLEIESDLNFAEIIYRFSQG